MELGTIVTYLDSFSISNLQTRIRNYRRSPLKDLSDKDARESIWEIVVSSGHAAYAPTFEMYPTGTVFWRARSILPDDDVLPLRSMRIADDAWAPKPELVKARGRLNLANESILYTCPENAALTVQEARIPAEATFSLIKFVARESINVVRIMASDTSNWELTDEQRVKYEMLMDFFETEFTREVGDGNEHLYRSSEFIAKDHFDLPPHVQDGWLYPSTVGKPSVNVAFRPEPASQKLKLQGVALCKWRAAEDGIVFSSNAFTDGSLNEENNFNWWLMDSDIQKNHFPEFNR